MLSGVGQAGEPFEMIHTLTPGAETSCDHYHV